MGKLALPLNVTEFGVTSDKLGDEFYISFHSCHSGRTLYVGDNELLTNPLNALKSTDINFVAEELIKLLSDKDFMDYLEASFIF